MRLVSRSLINIPLLLWNSLNPDFGSALHHRLLHSSRILPVLPFISTLYHHSKGYGFSLLPSLFLSLLSLFSLPSLSSLSLRLSFLSLIFLSLSLFPCFPSLFPSFSLFPRSLFLSLFFTLSLSLFILPSHPLLLSLFLPLTHRQMTETRNARSFIP